MLDKIIDDLCEKGFKKSEPQIIDLTYEDQLVVRLFLDENRAEFQDELTQLAPTMEIFDALIDWLEKWEFYLNLD